MAKILSVYNRLQAGDYENGNGGKKRVSRLTQFIHATLHLSDGSSVRNVVVQIPKFDAKPNPNPNTNPITLAITLTLA